MSRFDLGVAALLALAACHDGRPPAVTHAQAPVAPRRDVLSGIPAPFSRLNDTTGTAEAQHLEYGSLLSVDSVHNWYRTQLGKLGWSIESDAAQDTVATMHATRDSSALWLRVWHDTLITRFSLIGTTIRKQPAPPPPQRRFRVRRPT